MTRLVFDIETNDLPPNVKNIWCIVAKDLDTKHVYTFGPESIEEGMRTVEVILVAPVTTPASILIVPSNKIAEPEAGSIFIAAPESKVNTPAESMSTVPSAVI